MKVISVEDVSKKFILAHDRPKNLADAAKSVFARGEREEFWALRDVSFQVEQGEALGIIGHNGAGKSTMLKLLTKIMKPSKGRIRSRGRMSALIEVGAGFHPEMTGRENIYLNGSILGMTRREIGRRFDDIVAFAELEKFIDTPVKRYSSGMYARLGFSVAAHVEPEILVVDEVLSVGDASFQAKCAERIRQVRSEGITTVFVSHNFSAITTICSRVIGLWRGSIFADTTPAEAIALYREQLAAHPQQPGVAQSAELADIDSDLMITRVESISAAGEWRAYCAEPWTIRISYSTRRPVPLPEMAFRVTNSDGIVIAQPATIDYDQAKDVNGNGFLEYSTDHLPFLPGQYTVEVFAHNTTGTAAFDLGRHIYTLDVRRNIENSDIQGPGVRYGLIRMPGGWNWPSS